MYNVIQVYNQWAAETYEGRRIMHTVGVYPAKDKPGGATLFSLRNNSQLKKLGSDEDTLLALGSDGMLIGTENISSKLAEYRKNREIPAPVNMLNIALWAGSGGKIAFRLTGDGEILIFRNKMLVFAKRRSYWRAFPHKRLLEEFFAGYRSVEEEKNRLALYQTPLDLAFSRCGGCLGVMRAPEDRGDMRLLVASEALFSSLHPSGTAAMLNSRKFYEILRKIRGNLCSVDEAVIIDGRLGTILTVGAIVKTDGNPKSGGGRAATATWKCTTPITLSGVLLDGDASGGRGKGKNPFQRVFPLPLGPHPFFPDFLVVGDREAGRCPSEPVAVKSRKRIFIMRRVFRKCLFGRFFFD